MWKTIIDFPNYEVNIHGVVRRVETKRKLAIRTFKTARNKNRLYKYVRLFRNNEVKAFLIHRLIAQYFIPNPMMYKLVDHKDRNTLNNSIDNLRWCTLSQNAYNAKMPSHNKFSGKKGVSKRRAKWIARVTQNQKCIYLGSFSTIKEAKEAYNKKAQELAGEFFYEG